MIKAYYQVAHLSDDLLLVIHHRNLYSHVYRQEEFEKLYLQLSAHAATIDEAVKLLSASSM